MKTKAKLTLAFSALSAVVLATAVTSTFAWFTVKNEATANSGTLTVKSPSSLTITGWDLVENKALTQTSATQVDGDNANLGSVSSEYGRNFYAPADWTAASPSMVPVGSVTKNPYVGYLQYELAVTAAKGETGKSLQAVVTVTGDGAATTQLGAWYRVGLYVVGVDTSKTLAKSAGAKLSDSLSKVYGKADSTTDAYWDGSTKKTDRTVTALGVDAGTYTSGPLQLGNNFATSQSEDKTAHVIVAVWMEGYAAADQNAAGGQVINVSVNFSLYAY